MGIWYMLIGTIEYLLYIRISVCLNKDILASCEEPWHYI